MEYSYPCTFKEIQRLRETWYQSYAPVSMRALETWLRDCEIGLARIPALSMGKLSIVTNPYVTVRGTMDYHGATIEFAKVDVACMWSGVLAQGLKARHTMIERPEGFEFHFAALDSKSQYITGSWTVISKPAGSRSLTPAVSTGLRAR